MIRAFSTRRLGFNRAVTNLRNLLSSLPQEPLFHAQYIRSHHAPCSRFSRVPSMADKSFFSMATASFSSGASTAAGRDLLVQHLLVKQEDEKFLLKLEKRAAEGERLGDLATKYSICPSKEQEGMLGWLRKGQMASAFEAAAFGAPLNKIVKCKTGYGWHLLQVLSEREERVLEDIRPAEFHVKMQDKTFHDETQLIDVREPDEVEKASVPGFKVLPLQQFVQWGRDITTTLDPEKDTYVLCHHGKRSLEVAQWLHVVGFRRVFNITGGIHEYAVTVDPSIPTY